MHAQIDLQDVLARRFRLKSFRRGQLDILNSVLSDKDTLAVMPTGGGKSLCYQLPAVVRSGIVIVVSPLIALMLDQVEALRALGIPAGSLHSSQDINEKRKVFSELSTSDHYVLFVSPERIQKPGFAEWLSGPSGARIKLFAIDEAHCVSQWGPDFRQDYHRLEILRKLRPEIPILALTATATPMVLKDMARRLGLREPDRHVYGFYRPNLYCQVETCEDEDHKLRFIREAIERSTEGRILIYCGTRKQCEETSFFLKGFAGVGFYHAGMSAENRTQVQGDYQSGKIRILCATNAFGMGIDHPDVRVVIHQQMPATLEAYYQEMGRAGRDQQPSTCLLLYSKKDKGLHSYFIQQSSADQQNISLRWRALDAMVQFCEGGECRHAGILTYFKDTQRIADCGHCDVCLPDSPRRFVAPDAPASRSRRPRTSRISKPAHHQLAKKIEGSELRYEVLKDWRKAYAESLDVPAFIVFSNKTLEALADHDPSSMEELSAIPGLGPKRIETIGKLVLERLGTCRNA